MNKSSRIFITGATGLIGSYLIRLLIQNGYEWITGMKRTTSRLDLLEGYTDKIKWVEGDLFDMEMIHAAMANADVVVHTAAMISHHTGDFKDMMKINVQGTANVVNAALDNKIQHLHYISSIAALGRSTVSSTVTEKTQFQNDKFDTRYGLSKHLAEMEVWRGQAEGLDVSVINPSLILGAGYWKSGSPAYFATIARGIRFYPLGATGFVDIVDVTRMILRILEKGCSGERFICNGWNGTHRQLMKMISNRMHKKEPTLAVSKLLASIAWRMEWIRSLVNGKRPLITKESLRISREKFNFDNTKSVSELDFVYTPIEETIEALAVAYEESLSSNKDYGLTAV